MGEFGDWGMCALPVRGNGIEECRVHAQTGVQVLRKLGWLDGIQVVAPG